MQRILRPGGTLLVYVWAYEQEHKQFTNQDVFVPWHFQEKYEGGKNTKNTESEGLTNTAIKAEEKQSTVYHRYYHVFKKDELEGLFKELGGFEIIESYYDHANWAVEARKL